MTLRHDIKNLLPLARHAQTARRQAARQTFMILSRHEKRYVEQYFAPRGIVKLQPCSQPLTLVQTNMRDLQSRMFIYLKAFLFLVIGGVSVALLILQNPQLQTAILIALTIWSFSRAYYFAFYVIERYVDPQYRFSGLLSAAGYFLKPQLPPREH
jgi:hypothetical protein